MICINILVFCNVDLNQKWGDYTRVFSLMNAFSKHGHKIFVIIIRSEHKIPRISSFKENGIDVIEIHPPSVMKLKGTRGVGRYLNYLSCFPTVSKISSEIIKKNRIDYIYAYMPGMGSSLPAMRIQSKHKIKFILDFADLHVFVRPKKIVQISFEKADKIIAITQYLKDDLTTRGIDPKKIFIVPNGVNLEFFNPSKFQREEIEKLRHFFGANKLIVFSGALQDLNLLIDSASDVIQEIKDVKYVIIGDHRDPARSKSVWEEKVKQKGLGNYFVFLGRRPREDIPKYLLCADVCVDCFPNEPYYAAAHPVKLLEYGACGKPVVATRVSETEKIVKHGEFGFLADPDSPSEFADYVISLLKSNSLAIQMGANFSNYIRTNFDWDEIVINLEKILEI